MSVTKNTRSRKKVAQHGKAPDDSGHDVEFVEKYPNLGVVHEAKIRQFVSTVPIPQLRDYGARFYALVEALEAARQQPLAKTQRAVIKLIARLESESRNRHYRQILQAMAAAAASQEGISRAYWTALRAVEMTFEWTQEYMYAFELYKQWLEESWPAGGTTPAAKRPRR